MVSKHVTFEQVTRSLLNERFHLRPLEGRFEGVFNRFKITGNNVEGYLYLYDNNWLIAADYKDLYDKPANSPLRLPLPTTDKELEFLVTSLKWVGSKEGEEASAYFDYDKWIEGYPKDE